MEALEIPVPGGTGEPSFIHAVTQVCTLVRSPSCVPGTVPGPPDADMKRNHSYPVVDSREALYFKK